MKPADEAQELARLLAAEREELGGSVELLRQRGPDAAELASLSSRLALQGIDVSTPSPSPLPTPWKKWALGSGGAVSAALLWLALRGPQALPQPAHGAPLQPDSPPPVASLPSSPRAAQYDTNGRLRRAGVTTDARSPSVSAAVPSTPGPSRPLEGTVTSPTAHDHQRPGGPSGVEPIDARERRAARIAAAPTPDSPVLPPSRSDVPTEIELLRDARFALERAPARALDLTEQHARFHPSGKLVQEREVIAITALVALGRRTAALARGASFERAFPGSAYRKQVSELLR